MFRLLVRARLRMLANTIRTAPRWQLGVVAGLTLFSVGLFLVIAATTAALVLLAQNGRPVGAGLTPTALALLGKTDEYLFFFLLAGSIPFVSATLFQADDLPLLLTTPLPPRAIVAAKLLDACVVNAAQFVFLGVPVLAGLGWAVRLGFDGWLWLVVTTLLLLALPPAATALLLLAAARWLGMRRVRAVVMLVSVCLGLAVTMLAVVGASRAVRGGGLDWPRLQSVLRGAAPPQNLGGVIEQRSAGEEAPRWLPSAWATAVLEDTANRKHLGRRGGGGLLALASVTTLLIALCITLGQRVLASEQVLEAGPVEHGRRRGSRRGALARGLSPATSGLLIKDGKYVGRDLILLGQIGTALILFLVPFLLQIAQGTDGAMDNGLYGDLALALLGVVVYMVTSIVSLSSVGLEGRGFWLVLASPVSRAAFLRAKWLGSFLASAGVAAALTFIAWLAFHLSPLTAVGALAAFVSASFALSGLGVGLAGLFPRFVYESPAHRASVWALVLGFVLATGYVVFCGLLAGGAYLAVTQGRATAPVAQIAIAGFLLVSTLTGFVPVQLATRRLQNYEWE